MSNPAILNSLVADKDQQIKELENVLRLVTNNLNLLNDMEIKGAYALPVAEVLQWLDGFKRTLSDQLNTLRPAEAKVVEPEVINSKA